MELIDLLAQTFDHTGSLVAGVRTDQLDGATPCADWNVRALLSHTIGVVTNIGHGVRGEGLLADVNATALTSDPGAQFKTVAATTLAAWRGADLNAEVNIGAGPMPGSVAANINLLDSATHAWDIARATGQSEELPMNVAEAVFAASQQIVTPEIRQFAGFDAEVAVGADANPTERLVAFLGRNP